MPYIGASNISQSSFKTLKEKHSIKHSGVLNDFTSGSSLEMSTNSSLHEASDADMTHNDTRTCSSTANTTSNNSNTEISSRYKENSNTLKSDLEDEQQEEAQAQEQSQTKPEVEPALKSRRGYSVSSVVSNATDVEAGELFTLPNESTHAYSYNPLSPNSLAVRLSILKRSLEILIGNPKMLANQTPQSHQRGLTEFIARPMDESSILDGGKGIPRGKNNFLNTKQQKWSAHSAALNAFVTSTNASAASSGIQTPATSKPLFSKPIKGQNIQRASSVAFLSEQMHNCDGSNSLDNIYYNHIDNSSDIINAQKSDLESLLDLLNETLENNASENAANLHMISLLNINKLILGKDESTGRSTTQSQIRTLNLKKTLLNSLAEPFFEHYNLTEEEIEEDNKVVSESFEGLTGSTEDNPNPLTSIRPQQDYGRILHTFTSGKNIAPQAIFTCTQQHPWQFRAANDLACLTFGISKTALRALTLLDLIHTDSRHFVLSKILSTEGQELVFTGEIVAIVQPGFTNNNSNLIWASFWAKRKNDLLVCVFQKVPCDYVDVMLNLQDYSVDDISGGGGLFWNGQDESKNMPTPRSPKFELGEDDDKEEDDDEDSCEGDSLSNKCFDTIDSKPTSKKSVKFANEIQDIKELSQSLSKLIDDVIHNKVYSQNDDLLPMPIRVANHINEVRYFTLNHLSYNIPCAVSSSMLENELKLKIHSLPYEAGLFVVDSQTLQLISCNKSILKNMFGHHFAELGGRPLNDIIPSFSAMIQFINTKYPALSITQNKNRGLVLTEHFFRKIQAEMVHKPEEFYTSVGIDALHKDGCFIKVDFQLRVMNPNIILLWITHSRDVVFKDYTTTPSQLHMLKENELAYVSSDNSSETSSKKSSAKIPLDKMKDMRIDDDKNVEDSGSKKVLQMKPSSLTNLLPPNEVLLKSGDEDATAHIEVGDPELQRKLDLTRIYTKDKSQFVKEGNFKLDELLIKSITSTPQSTESNLSLDKLPSNCGSTAATTTSHSTSDPVPIFLNTPEVNIGAQKHIKKFTDFIILQKMGEGAYGKVNLCLHKRERYIVVIKMIFKERILVDTWVRDRKLGTIPSEIQIMATLNKHPDENILRLLDFFEDDEYYYIETPVHGETGCIDLFDLIELKTNMTEFEAKLIFKQVVSGVKHLHDQGIVHRDIKDENVIVDSKGFVKLIDFGSAAYVKSGPFDVFVGTIDYAAPEVLGGEPYEGKPQDIWAIGILLYTIVFKENPFYNIDEILEGALKFSNHSDVSEECIDLITRILNKCAPKRPTIDAVYNDVWLQI